MGFKAKLMSPLSLAKKKLSIFLPGTFIPVCLQNQFTLSTPPPSTYIRLAQSTAKCISRSTYVLKLSYVWLRITQFRYSSHCVQEHCCKDNLVGWYCAFLNWLDSVRCFSMLHLARFDILLITLKYHCYEIVLLPNEVGFPFDICRWSDITQCSILCAQLPELPSFSSQKAISTIPLLKIHASLSLRSSSTAIHLTYDDVHLVQHFYTKMK